MADLHIPITSATPCRGEQGAYFAETYYADNQGTHYIQLDLGREIGNFEHPPALIDRVRHDLGIELKLDEDLPLDQVAAVGLVRICMRDQHISRTAPGRSLTGERVASYFLTRAGVQPEMIEPVFRPRNGHLHGIMPVRRKDERGMAPIASAIYLPTAPIERNHFLARTVIKALPEIGPVSLRPYVILNSSPSGRATLEKPLSVERLR